MAKNMITQKTIFNVLSHSVRKLDLKGTYVPPGLLEESVHMPLKQEKSVNHLHDFFSIFMSVSLFLHLNFDRLIGLMPVLRFSPLGKFTVGKIKDVRSGHSIIVICRSFVFAVFEYFYLLTTIVNLSPSNSIRFADSLYDFALGHAERKIGEFSSCGAT